MNAMQGVDRPSDRALLVALNAAPGLPRAAICQLARELEAFRKPASPGGERALAARFSIPLDSIRAAVASFAGAAAALAAEEQAAGRLGAELVTRLDPAYPIRLHDLGLPPPVLAVAGSMAALACQPADRLAEPTAGDPPAPDPTLPAGPAPTVAIVGSRRATPYGLEVASWLARELAEHGVVVISGFAKGIDAAAHQGALAAERGRTIGVLGCGLSCDYPKGHRDLGLRIRSHGALISEFPCALAPSPANFPVRNRIIAALAEITVVVEAAPQSGSLITARLALELGREVLAVPGRITDEQALGANDLLRDGAGPVTHPADILDRLGLPSSAARSTTPGGRWAGPANLPPAQTAVLEALDPTRDLGVDFIAATAGVGIDLAVGALLELELAGWAIRAAGGGYRRGTP